MSLFDKVKTRRGKRVRFSLPLPVSEEAKSCEKELNPSRETTDSEREGNEQSCYIPPQKRREGRTELAWLRRRIQGLVNRWALWQGKGLLAVKSPLLSACETALFKVFVVGIFFLLGLHNFICAACNSILQYFKWFVNTLD